MRDPQIEGALSALVSQKGFITHAKREGERSRCDSACREDLQDEYSLTQAWIIGALKIILGCSEKLRNIA